MARTFLTEFSQALRARCRAQGFSVDRWTGAQPSSANILAVVTGTEEALLYVKCRGVPPGFWGITDNRIRELRSSGKSWHVVLLVGSPEEGYVVPSTEVLTRTSNGTWRLSGDGDYKINERPGEVGGLVRHTSFESLLNACLPVLGKAG